MTDKNGISSKKGVLLFLTALTLCFIIAGAVCMLAAASRGSGMYSQTSAERWRGDSELKYSQFSIFMPDSKGVSTEQIYKFRRDLIDRNHEAGFDAEADAMSLFTDCWCAKGKAEIISDYGKADASFTAAGGNFFHFHPLSLSGGSWFSEYDENIDRVVLDEELAWCLFGGTELQGETVFVGGIPCVVAGVIQREQDKNSIASYTDGMGMYISWDLYTELSGGKPQTAFCYEIVMPDPLDNYAASFIKEKFPSGDGRTVMNTGRFSLKSLASSRKEGAARIISLTAVSLPYWEKSALLTQQTAEKLLGASILLFHLAAVPAAAGVIYFIRKRRSEAE